MSFVLFHLKMLHFQNVKVVTSMTSCALAAVHAALEVTCDRITNVSLQGENGRSICSTEAALSHRNRTQSCDQK